MAKRKPKSKKKTESARQPFAELPPSLDIRKVGRPSKYHTSFCDLVLDLGAEGKSKAQIAAALGISRETLHAWCKQYPAFSDAIKAAADLALAWWENAGQTNMTRQGFNATAFIFQMKNRFRDDYRDASEITGKDGKDLIPDKPVTAFDLARYMAFILEQASERKPNGHANGHAT
jgi:hypothetical protein